MAHHAVHDLYALHDAMLKPMPGKPRRRVWRESWSASEDGMTYDFVLREGVTFHNGEPVTAEDVKFSFERYRGAAHALMQAGRLGGDCRSTARPFKLKDPGRTSYLLCRPPPAPAGSCRRSMSRRSATTASRRHRSAPGHISSSRSRRASNWCSTRMTNTGARPPSVKRIVLRVIPEESTRLAALKRGEVDIA